MTRNVTIKTWYVVSGTAGATVKSEDGTVTFCTIPEGGQGYFYATADKVVTSDDSVKITEATFNRAALALRLLGGGVKSELPAGYLRAEFLESTGTQYINTGIEADLQRDLSLEFETNYSDVAMEVFGWRVSRGRPSCCLFVFPTYMRFDIGGVGQQCFFYSMKNGNRNTFFVSFETKTATLNDETCTIAPTALEKTGVITLFLVNGMPADSKFKGKIYKAEIHGRLNGVPALTTDGIPCFFNKVDAKALKNKGTGSFIVGFTLAQARKLGAHLPDGGGELTISLPTGYEQDSAVAESLETARAKGWTLTVQTYEAETVVATFGLRRIWVRRIWVRRVQDEQGAYVDADGVRWRVEWCVDMVTPDGSTPDAHGYELYRSTEAAVAYWELTPWIDPEAEQEFLTTEEQ